MKLVELHKKKVKQKDGTTKEINWKDEIEFLVTGYEFPDKKTIGNEDDFADSNWLNDAVIFNGKTYCLAGILISEICNFVKKMESVLAGELIKCELEPIEIGLKMKARKNKNKFSFSIEFGINDIRKVTQELTKEEFIEKINDLKDILKKYPVR